jgi:type I restriction enzyme, S subunit
MSERWKFDKLESVITQFIVPQRDRPKVFDGNVPWCRIEDFDGIYLSKSKSGLCVSQEIIDSMPLRVYPIGTVIVSCSADLGRCAIIATPLITNQTFIGLVPSSDIDSLYLYYLMGSKADELNSMASGATIKYLSKKKFQELEIPIPPLTEQKQIVAILDQAFEAIDQAKANIEKNIQNAQELFQSKLNAIFSQKGDGWKEKLLKDVITLKSGTTISKSLEKSSGEIPYLMVSDMNIEGNEFEITTSTKFVDSNDIKENSILPIGTIIFPKRGGAIATNKKRITTLPICVDLNTMGAIPSSIIYSEYLHFYFRSFDLMDIANGTTIPQINNYSFDSLKISIPTDKDTQYEIVEDLENFRTRLSDVEKVYQKKLEDLEELKKSILQKAFAGELTNKEVVYE